MAEYVLTLNSQQARETLKAVELLMRLKLKQFDVLPYNLLDIAKKDYADKRDQAAPYLKAVENIFFPFASDYQKDAEWYRLYNLYQVLRFAIHEAEHPETTGVDSYPPMKMTDEPLPKIEWKVNDN